MGASTGTTMWAALKLVAQMEAHGEVGSVVTIIGDGGERYMTTYARDDWLDSHGITTEHYAEVLSDFYSTGSLEVALSLDPRG